MSNARSPREVCSITIGINGIARHPPRGVSAAALHPARGVSARLKPGTRLWRSKLRPLASASWGPQLRIARALLLLRGPELLTRRREVGGDPLHIGDDPVERLAQEEVLAQLLRPAVVPDALDDRVRILLPGLERLLADELAQLVVSHLEPELPGDGL